MSKKTLTYRLMSEAIENSDMILMERYLRLISLGISALVFVGLGLILSVILVLVLSC